jgi:hypothetical protein
VLSYDAELEALRILADPRDELSKSRVQAANWLRPLLPELVPGQSKRHITTGQVKTILASVRPRGVVGRARRRLAAEQVTERILLEKKIKPLTRELKAIVLASGSALMELPGGRAGRGSTDVGRCRRRRSVRRPQPVRALDRDSPHRSLLWGDV